MAGRTPEETDVEVAESGEGIVDPRSSEVTRREFMRRGVAVAAWTSGFFALGAALADRAYAWCYCGSPHGVDDGYPGGWCFTHFTGMGGHYHDPDQHGCIGTHDCTDDDKYYCPSEVICGSHFACTNTQYKCTNRDFSCDGGFNCCYYKCNTGANLHTCAPDFVCTPGSQYTQGC